jgi:hypothetical protein
MTQLSINIPKIFQKRIKSMLFIRYFIIRLNQRFRKLDETCSFLFRRIVVETTREIQNDLSILPAEAGQWFQAHYQDSFKRKFIG